jgi:hypothetical protein
MLNLSANGGWYRGPDSRYAGSAKNKVVLGRLPNGALKLSPDDFVNTIYTVVNDDTKGSLPYPGCKKRTGCGSPSSLIPLPH